LRKIGNYCRIQLFFIAEYVNRGCRAIWRMASLCVSLRHWHIPSALKDPHIKLLCIIRVVDVYIFSARHENETARVNWHDREHCLCVYDSLFLRPQIATPRIRCRKNNWLHWRFQSNLPDILQSKANIRETSKLYEIIIN